MNVPHRFGFGRKAADAIALIALTTCAVAVAERASDEQAELLDKAKSHFQVLPRDAATADHPIAEQRVRLGRMLFFDTRISDDGTVSCARCHQPPFWGTDALPTSIGAQGRVHTRNAPTVFNAALHTSIHWDGRFANVEEQAKTALIGQAFGNRDFAAARARIKAISGYAALFSEAFSGEAEPITEDNWAKAIGAYERTLISQSRFDDYLGGKPDSLSRAELNGLRLFMEIGCVSCHKGQGVGGTGFRKFGVFSDYRLATGSRGNDTGRFKLTKNSDDIDRFKVPGLRGAALTPPYFHDGSVDTLPKAVRIMGKVQLDIDLVAADVDAIVEFLRSLSGPTPESFERLPLLPTGGFTNPPTTAH